jgi:ATP-dependent DNA helicase PIF1
MGTVHDLSWDVGQDPSSSLPSVILVKVDDYEGPAFPDCGDGIVPVFAATRQFEFKGAACSRTQFPMRLAYAITVHKSQGLTLQRAVMDLSKREHTLGLAYVALSRVKSIRGVLFERSFDFDRFKRKDSPMSRDREIDRTFRAGQLL